MTVPRVCFVASICFFACFCCATQAQIRVALVIGNATYDQESTLRNPVNDALLIRATLKEKLGFDEVFLATNVGRVALMREVARFRAAAKGAHTALIYYSGHGMINSRRQNYVLPVDMPMLAANAAADPDTELKTHAVAEDELVEAVEGASDVQLVVIDACRDNGFLPGRSGSKGLARRSDHSRNRLVAYATEEGRVAEDGVGNNSPYAASLARHILRRDISVLAVFDGVASDVERQTQHRQVPTRSGNLRVDVYLFPGAAGASYSGQRSDPDEEAWKAASAADVAEGYEFYLKDFPNGRNVSAARIKVAALKRHDPPPNGYGKTNYTLGDPNFNSQSIWDVKPSSVTQTTSRIVGSTDCGDCPEQRVWLLEEKEPSTKPALTATSQRVDGKVPEQTSQAESKLSGGSKSIGRHVKPGEVVAREGLTWMWPTTGRVASEFDERSALRGVDIAASVGTAIVAVANGKVIYIGKEPRGLGQMIVVSHTSEWVSVYFYADRVQVKEQQRVIAGQVIAAVGDFADKIHFSVRRLGRPMDPLTVMPR